MTSNSLMKSIRGAALAAVTLLPSAGPALAQAVPNNFMQVGPGRRLANGTLHFDYSWGSSSGRLADLANCVVGEVVTYPSRDNPFPFPNPPWNRMCQPDSLVGSSDRWGGSG